VLWLHDVRLPGLFTTYALADRLDPKDAGPRFLLERLLRQYRRRLPLPFLHQPAQALEEFQAQGLGLTEELVDIARTVVVSSPLAERLLRLDQPPDAQLPPVHVLPLAFPEPWGNDAGRRPPSRPLLACFGVVAPVKGVEVLLTALATLRAQGVDAEVALVGHVDDGYRQHLHDLADRLGVPQAVTITGRVDPATYRRWQGEATLAVQLRLGTNGEASAALTDCLAAGVPTLTNVAGDVPAGAAVELAWDADSNVVAVAVAELLAHPARLAELATAGRAAAAAWGFGRVAERLLEVVRDL
jgi:glycosyltransferase involved in cell wall biosynthesis